jgi:hypothetical protein
MLNDSSQLIEMTALLLISEAQKEAIFNNLR